MLDIEDELTRAAIAIRDADAVLIGAGAGMGVDSGLPDFRGDAGFWTAYPPFRGKRFSEISNPVWFHRDPEQAWGFFGHRMNLYRETQPHAGFQILRDLTDGKTNGVFVFTSNVDGHFQRAGFAADTVIECHGALSHLQCVTPCSDQIWAADDFSVDVDSETIRASGTLPVCQSCGGLARPNVLMFDDYKWVERRHATQNARYQRWLKSVGASRLTVIEIGAGTAVPSVRYECEAKYAQLVRINPRDWTVPEAGISLPLGALDALGRIRDRLGQL